MVSSLTSNTIYKKEAVRNSQILPAIEAKSTKSIIILKSVMSNKKNGLYN